METEESLLARVLERQHRLEYVLQEERSRSQKHRQLYLRLKDLYTSQQDKVKVLQTELAQVHSESSKILTTSRTALDKADHTILEQQGQLDRLEEQLRRQQCAPSGPSGELQEARVLELEMECGRLSSMLEHTSASHSRSLDLLRAEYQAKIELLLQQGQGEPPPRMVEDPALLATLQELREELQESNLKVSLQAQQIELVKKQHADTLAEMAARLQDLESQLYKSRKHNAGLEDLLAHNKETFAEMRAALKKHQEEGQVLRRRLREAQRNSRQSSLSAQMATAKLQRACATQTEKLRLHITELEVGMEDADKHKKVIQEKEKEFHLELEKLELEHSHKILRLEEEKHKSDSKLAELQHSKDHLLKEMEIMKDSTLSDKLEEKMCSLRKELDQALEQTSHSEQMAQENLRLQDQLRSLSERHLQYGDTVRDLHLSLQALKKETARELSKAMEHFSMEQRQLHHELEQVKLELLEERQKNYQERQLCSQLTAHLKSRADLLSGHSKDLPSAGILVQEVQHCTSKLTELLQLS